MVDTDVIVIGSGIGGLTTAVFLAKAGRRVVVLERHYEPGGLTHTFQRQGWVWDVGLHYLGDLAPGSENARVADWVSGGRLRWVPFPGAVEDLRAAGRRVVQHAGYDRAVQSWCDQFPHEAPRLRRYFHRLRRSAAWMRRHRIFASLPPALRWAAFPMVWGRGWSGRTLLTVLEDFRDPSLKRLLAATWADYGVRPDQASFGIHALVVAHYLGGAWAPEGGAAAVAQTLGDELAAHGGRLEVCQDVGEIIVENGRVRGVRVTDLTTGTERTLTAPRVVSAVGAEATFQGLLSHVRTPGVDGLRRRMSGLPRGASMFIVFLGLTASPRSLGHQGQNTWVHDLDAGVPLADATRALLAGGPPATAFLSCPSARSTEGRPTAQVMVAVDPQVFAADPRCATRPGYEALKADLADRLVALADAHWPGLASLVAYRETAGPATVERFTGRPQGAMYGLAETPARLDLGLGAPTPVAGLTLAGSDVCSLGVVGAMMGGFLAAGSILGFPRVFADLGRKPSTVSGSPATDPRVTGRAALVSRRAHGPRVTEYTFEQAEDAPPWRPWAGAFVRLRVGGPWRAYSVARTTPRGFSLLVDGSGQGVGARFLGSLPVGASVDYQGPLGSFRYQGRPGPVVFVASGTGLAPLLPMVAQATAEGREVRVVLAARNHSENWGPALIQEILTPEPGRKTPSVVTFFSQPTEPVSAGERRGRVSGLADLGPLGPQADVYLCCHPDLARALVGWLGARPDVRVFQEAF